MRGSGALWSSVAELVSRLVSFDRMLVATFEDSSAAAPADRGLRGRGARLPAKRVLAQALPELSANFPARPARPASEDALDPEYPEDHELREAGLRSFLRGRLDGEDGTRGAFWLASRREDAFSPEHESVLPAIAKLLTSASERERLRRTAVLDALLPTLAEALDVREVFQKISQVAQQVIPHDFMSVIMVLLTLVWSYAFSKRGARLITDREWRLR